MIPNLLLALGQGTPKIVEQWEKLCNKELHYEMVLRWQKLHLNQCLVDYVDKGSLPKSTRE